jgi:hypothetical protein
MKDRLTFSKYIYDLHEHINKMLHKKSNLSFSKVQERYEHFRARCTEETPKVFNFLELNKFDSKNKNNSKKNSKSKSKSKSRKNNKEIGCTEPLYGKKSKCIIKIVPQDKKVETFQIDKKCVKTRSNK